MSIDNAKLEEHIQNLRNGSTLKENEVRALCEQVRKGGIFSHSDTPCWTE